MGNPPKRQEAVLVAVHLPDADDLEFTSSLEELERLVSTLGYKTVAKVTQNRTHLETAAVLGEGKLKELGDLTGGDGHVGTTAPKKKDKARLRREAEAGGDFDDDGDVDVEEEDDDFGVDGERTAKVDLVAVDHDLSPSQARNLERATGAAVLDRTGVIIEIFHRHAKSREARLQVEIARLTYTAPRLRESPSGKERQRGRGAGEAALELDRRKVRDRIAELKEELVAVQRDQDVRRSHRRQARRIALVGYTNAGKSSLMRALTGSDVYVENKLFATLDTTVRALYPEPKPRILVSDTVGFIKKLPHDLVASFKSTLDEALEASHLLHVVDAADPSWESQLAVTREVLEEIGAGEVPSTLVMNKIDRLAPEELAALRVRLPDAWFVSAHDPSDVASVRERIIGIFEATYVESEFVIPYDRQAVLSEMHDSGRVSAERYEENGVIVTYRAEPEVIARFRSKLERAR
ncbi:GTPase HflX [Labilithrix luteola]|uniref:GTPase HflX n=1 Tax=Labilithrix luteola TaxID=1391654 RepID=UPI000AD4C3A9|nr:GTPase HflX [Labilithrix luteola]